MKAIQGITNVYDSSEAKGFDNSKDYPIAWEVIFVNDKTGKEFSLNTIKAFTELPKEQGYVMDFQGDHRDPTLCLECVFKNKDAFRKILNETFKDIAFFDEQTQVVIPKMKMLQDAGKVLSNKMALAI